MPRVGSEYRDEGRDRAQWALRQAFLRQVEHLALEVHQNLLDTVLPAYQASTSQGGFPQGSLPWKWDRQRWEGVDPAVYPLNAQLRAALLAWGERYHLTDDWLLEVALLTVHQQYEWEQEARGRLHEGLLIKSPPDELAGFASVPFADIAQVPPPFTFTFRHRAWIPWWQLWEQYEAELREALRNVLKKTLRKTLRAHQNARRAEARKLGLKRTPWKRERDRHLAWLVRWQVQKRDRGWIGREYNAGNRTVLDAIQRMADALGLTLRRGKPGRPPDC